MAIYDAKGREIPDPTPVSLPFPFKRPEPLVDLIRRSIREEFSRNAAAEGEESFEDADDFEVDEDPDLFSPYQLTDAQVERVDQDAAPPPDPAKQSPVQAPGASPTVVRTAVEPSTPPKDEKAT